MQTEEDIPDDDVIPQAFAVDDTDDNFDLNIPPTTGNEYLRRVRQEARECSRVVVAPIDAKAFNSKQTVKYTEPSSCLPPPRGLAPSPAWEKMQVADFAELRQKLLRFRAMLNSGELNLKRPTLPSTNDADNWCRLCFDRLKIKTVASECFEESVEPMVEGSAMPLGAYNITDQPSTSQASMQGTPPLLSIVLFMDQTMVIKVLEYHVNWLEATGFTSHQVTKCTDAVTTIFKGCVAIHFRAEKHDRNQQRECIYVLETKESLEFCRFSIYDCDVIFIASQ
ncbi:gem-associated protein 2-like isoform X2 [Haliotis cracherodii]|uniref:gem-associated protein 2-like isoform X2 n=1 Tax=Haliotis cracherodii TaxID=6455 RepID=UPI0039E80CD0